MGPSKFTFTIKDWEGNNTVEAMCKGTDRIYKPFIGGFGFVPIDDEAFLLFPLLFC